MFFFFFFDEETGKTEKVPVEGLPAEIEAQKTRYEYYRNKLLTFKPLPA